MTYPLYQYNLFKAIAETEKSHGAKELFRTKWLAQYSSIMRISDPSHTDKTPGHHIEAMMKRVEAELAATILKDRNHNGNVKKGSVRLAF